MSIYATSLEKPRGHMRNFRKEYDDYHAKPEQVARRASRNKARADAEKTGSVHKGDGKEVDHKDMNPLNNSSRNKRVISKSANRSRQPKTKG